MPRANADEIDLYIRTYYSLLRSSGDVRVRAFEESHIYSRSSLHPEAAEAVPDLAAFAYAAGRLPDCMPRVRRIILGQSFDQFHDAGYQVEQWEVVRTRGRRRPLRYDGGSVLAAFIASASDIDDLVPIVTAYQIEWNKMRMRLLAQRMTDFVDDAALAEALGVDQTGVARLRNALGPRSTEVLREMTQHDADLFIRLLDGSYREYQRSTQRWWSEIAQGGPGETVSVYFVSSNSHSLANLFGGWLRAPLHQADIVEYLRSRDTENLAPVYDEALSKGDTSLATNILYYALRAYLRNNPDRMAHVQESDAAAGLRAEVSPGKIDVDAQIIEMSIAWKLDHLDPRVLVPGIERLAASRAVIINIDYPLGMAAYHHLSAIALGVEELRGIYVMGKAATLNGRVGDVMISKAVHDEHSDNTYLFVNAIRASDVAPYMKYGTVLDNQKALTVRSAFLQNREYMDVFYREGYTVMEMEAGPYLSAAYEIAEPRRHPKDELVSLVDRHLVDVGVIHYASDTPYSRRQSLLSKSMSYFGMESTYACSIAIARRIFTAELARLASTSVV